MMDYFLSANTSLREVFKHNFVEHTFIGTSYCEHCKGVVSKTHRLLLSVLNVIIIKDIFYLVFVIVIDS